MKTKILVGTQSNVQSGVDVLAKDGQEVRITAIAVDGGSIVAAVEVSDYEGKETTSGFVLQCVEDGTHRFVSGINNETVGDINKAVTFFYRDPAEVLAKSLGGGFTVERYEF